MKKLTILVGISNSGKSSFAHEQWMIDPLNTVIVNRDKIRELLFGFTEQTIKEYYKLRDVHLFEKQVTRYEDTLINDGLCADKHVIVDATHLKRGYIERFKYWNVPTEVESFNVTISEAVIRDIKRDRQVGDDVIKRQYARFVSLYNNLKVSPIDFTPVEFVNNPKLPPTIIYDLDGTVAKMTSGRNPYDWKRVGEDTVDKSVAEVIRCISMEYDTMQHAKVIACTGRDGVAEYETKKWLDKYGIYYDKFYIRKQGDNRPDWVIKEEIWREIAKEHYIVGMFDDRLQVVRRARALGIKVFNVEYNNF